MELKGLGPTKNPLRSPLVACFKGTKPRNFVQMSLTDTASFRKKSIGQESIGKASVSQVSQLVKYVNWSSCKE